MEKISFAKFIIVLIAILVISASGYAGWRIWKDTEGIESQTDQNLVNKNLKPKKETSKSIETPKIDISNWEPYRNEKYEFEIRYPQSFIIRDSIIANCKGVSFLDEEFLSYHVTSVNMMVSFDIFVEEDGTKCISGHYSLPSGPGFSTYELLSSESVMINNKEFLKKNYKDIVPNEDVQPFKFSSWHIENKGRKYTLLYNNNVGVNPEPHIELFNQILSTLQFFQASHSNGI